MPTDLQAAKKLLPPGFVIVPERPTEAMMEAGNYQSSADSTSADVHSIYVDMVAIAARDF